MGMIFGRFGHTLPMKLLDFWGCAISFQLNYDSKRSELHAAAEKMRTPHMPAQSLPQRGKQTENERQGLTSPLILYLLPLVCLKGNEGSWPATASNNHVQ